MTVFVYFFDLAVMYVYAPAPAAITPFVIIDVVSGFVLRNLPAKVTTLSSTTPKPNHAAVVFKLAFTGLILATGLAFRPSIVFWSFFAVKVFGVFVLNVIGDIIFIYLI